MNRLLELLTEYWLTVVLVLGMAVGAVSLFVGRRRVWLPSMAALLFVGNLFFQYVRISDFKPGELAGWLALAVGGLMLLKGLNLLLTGKWWPKVFLGFTMLLLFAGGALVPWLQTQGAYGLRSLRTLEFVQPWWLLLLLVIPLLVRFSYQSLAGLGPVRRWVALGLRCALVALLVVALAEPRLRRPNDSVTVLFLVDRSMSVPIEMEFNESETDRDRRWTRIQQFVNSSVEQRGPLHRNDLAGGILFAKRPRLILPPGNVNKLILSDNLAGQMDANYTDVAAALKLAMASFPEGTGKRVVLFSDGNENLGNAEEQANLAKQNGVQIDVVPLAEGYRHQNEVMVQAVEAPPQTTKGARLPVRVLLRNAHPNRIVFGKLELLQNRDGKERPIGMVGRGEEEKSPYSVKLQPGLTGFTFRDKAEAKKGEEEISYSYRAVFVPEGSSNPDNTDRTVGLNGDRIQNNRAMAHVIARGSRRVLFIEPDIAPDGKFPHEHLIDQLRGAKFSVAPIVVGRLPLNKDELTVFLSNYDCVVIGDVPAEAFSKDQHETIRSNTYDQGCGLVFVGGKDSYGAGGYQKTPIEAALPVDCEIKAMKAAGRGGLVLVMHASEMAKGNDWQMRIAKLAIERLSANDMVGVVYYDGNVRWQIPFQVVGEDKGRLYALVDRMVPGDMPDFDPFLKASYDTLSDPQHGLAVKHCIVISDGDPSLGAIGRTALGNMKTDGITCTTVGVATHSPAEDGKLGEIADSAARGGRYYNVKNPEDLPQIYMRESRRVSQSFMYTQRFNPKLVLRSGPTDKLDPPLPDLHGFVRTTLKPSPLVEMLVEGPRTFDQKFPILATWQYGVGRSAAFTSDAYAQPGVPTKAWDREWAGSEIYLKFWEQVVAWAMRGLETDRMILTTEYREGKVRVVVEARDENNRPLTDLKMEGKVSTPGGLEGPAIDLKFEQRAGGYYEAEFKAEEAGSYIVNAQAKQQAPAYKGRFRSGLPLTTVEKDGQLQLADGTPVRKGPDGKLLYADDGTPVVLEQEAERTIDSRRAGMTISYSPEFADLETNSTLLKTLASITGGNVYKEDSKVFKEIAASGELFRPAPEGVRALLPLWYWLVFLVGVLLLLDVGVRRIALEPGEVRTAATRVWNRFRKEKTPLPASESDDAFLARLRQKKTETGENLERDKATRKFDGPATGDAPPPPPGADDAPPPSAPAFKPKPPPTPAPAEKPPEAEPEDYMSKLRKAKKRAPHERDE